MSFAKYAASEAGKPEGLFAGYPIFEVPQYVADYKGQVPAVILLDLYNRACGESNKSHTEREITFSVRLDNLALKTGLSTRSIKRGVARLRKDKRIALSERPRRSDGRYLAYEVTLLDNSGSPLQTSPGEYRVCWWNEIRPFITVPRGWLGSVNKMKLPSQLAVYLTALDFVSQQKRQSAYVEVEQWRQRAGLGERKNAFDAGVSYCQRKGLLTYKGGEVLTVNNPKTPPRGWTDHVNPQWKFDLDTVPAEVWQQVIETMLGRKFEVGADGWCLRSECPFCHDHKERFHLSFEKSAFRCHICGKRGRLGQLISQLKNIPMSAVKDLLKQSIEPEQEIVTV